MAQSIHLLRWSNADYPCPVQKHCIAESTRAGWDCGAHALALSLVSKCALSCSPSDRRQDSLLHFDKAKQVTPPTPGRSFHMAEKIGEVFDNGFTVFDDIISLERNMLPHLVRAGCISPGFAKNEPWYAESRFDFIIFHHYRARLFNTRASEITSTF